MTFPTNPVRIVGTFADGRTLTAEQYHSHVDGEWFDTHFGQAFDLSLDVIGPDVPRERVLAETLHSFWEGIERVVYVDEHKAAAPAAGKTCASLGCDRICEHADDPHCDWCIIDMAGGYG